MLRGNQQVLFIAYMLMKMNKPLKTFKDLFTK
jgi:hypothetical protein